MTPFLACLSDALKEGKLSKEKRDGVVTFYERKFKEFKRQGMSNETAAAKAQEYAYMEIDTLVADKTKAALNALEILHNNTMIVERAKKIPVFFRQGVGDGLGRALITVIEKDDRFKNISYAEYNEIYRGRYRALPNLSMREFDKGFMGTQKGKMHEDDVTAEAYGRDSGNPIAKRFVEDYVKMQRVWHSDFNNAGGSMRWREGFSLPQGLTEAGVAKRPVQEFIDDYINNTDWNKTTWENGDPIPESDRARVATEIRNTLASGGASKIDPAAFNGRGRSLGNMLDNHRFTVYKDDKAWKFMHDKYGDGSSVFEVITRHMDSMAHKVAMLKAFGRNPSITKANMIALVEKAAADVQADPAYANRKNASAVADLQSSVKIFNIMFDKVSRHNYLDPTSIKGALVTSVASTLTSAQLGSIPLIAIPSDMLTMTLRKLANNQSLTMPVSTYLKTIATDFKHQADIANQSGFLFDQLASHSFSTQRFTGLASHGPAITSRISDAVMRLSGNAAHTDAARWAPQQEYMRMAHRHKGLPFDQLPDKLVLERYGITPADWDAVRHNVASAELDPGVFGLRPIDILNSDVADKSRLFEKFQAMILTESERMIPKASIEATAHLSLGAKPDTWPGIILSSFMMYKNFPVTLMLQQARAVLTMSGSSKLAYLATLGLGSIAVGAMATQLRELVKGRSPLPMDDYRFMLRALMAGGGLSIWGDFLYSGVNEYGNGPESYMAGPIGSLATDILGLTLGTGYAWVEAADKGKQWESKLPGRLVEFARRNTPGSSLWWARMALEREVWDRAQEWADPRAHEKQQRKIGNQQRNYGNDYIVKPGDKPITDMLGG